MMMSGAALGEAPRLARAADQGHHLHTGAMRLLDEPVRCAEPSGNRRDTAVKRDVDLRTGEFERQ